MNNPEMETEEKNFKVGELRGFARKDGGIWIACSYIDRGGKRIVMSMAHGKRKLKVLSDAMTKGIERCDKEDT